MKAILSVRFIIIFLLIAFLLVGSVFAQFGSGDEPARLRDLEPLLVQLIYVIWALGGIIFTAALMFIGFLYMTSAGDPQKQEALKKRATNWLFGLILFFAGYPLVLTAYNVLDIGQSNPDCYKSVSTPGFHFFFPDVCTDPLEGTEFLVGQTVQKANLTEEEFIQKLIDGKRCVLNDKYAPVESYIFSKDDYKLYKYKMESNGNCLKYDIVVRNSVDMRNREYLYVFRDGKIFEEDGTFYVYGGNCSNDGIKNTGRQDMCCLGDQGKHFVVPSRTASENDEQGGSKRQYVRMLDGTITYFWYDAKGNDIGACDCERDGNTTGSGTTCKSFSGVRVSLDLSNISGVQVP